MVFGVSASLLASTGLELHLEEGQEALQHVQVLVGLQHALHHGILLKPDTLTTPFSNNNNRGGFILGVSEEGG